LILLIDIGNTRTKWALADKNGQLSAVKSCLNTEIAKAELPIQEAQTTLIANVAGQAMAENITYELKPLPAQFLTVSASAYGLTNFYAPTLGVDRWAALVAAWHTYHQPIVVVNAGTAITIDAISQAGEFLGGSIIPGLHLMRASLSKNAALLNVEAGEWQAFPTNTSDAIQSGMFNAVVGAINLTLKRLEKHATSAPLLLLSGGDAEVIAEALALQSLNLDTKQVIITQNLVLHGLALLAEV
jgi:type III pantothenate kinase